MSHHKMSTGPSGQDETQMAYYANNDDVPYAVRIITNLAGECNVTIFDYERGLRFNDARILREAPVADSSLRQVLLDRIESVVTRQSHATYPTPGKTAGTGTGVRKYEPPTYSQGARTDTSSRAGLIVSSRATDEILRQFGYL